MSEEEDADADVEDAVFVDSVDPGLSPASPGSSSPDGRGDTIRVFVRVRPLNGREDFAHMRDGIYVDAESGTVQLFAEPPRSFAFDGVLRESATQTEVFQLFGAGVAEFCLSGYNGSIYVYGQTGSGKTHTMQGEVVSVQSMHNGEQRGLMCRILDYIFAEIGRRNQTGGTIQHSCKCSYLEIYKEQITDLLEPSSTNLQIREDINHGVYVERLSEHSVWSAADAFHVVWKGLHQRHVASTQMNELSSRSHSVFTLKVEASSTTAGGVTSTKIARLNLIDLAGSERQTFDPHNPSAHESIRVKEAGAINRSLSALTNVIMSLSHGRRKVSAAGQRQPFVRYRDSKLTFLLRDSLGGNSKTVIVACISPAAMCFGETLSTLKFASRAKHIRCAAVMNEEYSGTVESLVLEVKSLRQQLDLLSSRGLAMEASDLKTRSSSSRPRDTRKRREEASVEAALEEALQAGASEDLRCLYGPRRIRRLEILLAAALDRERRCELRRHKVDKVSQYLNMVLERKEHYFDALRDYFSFLVDHAAGEACYLPELIARLVVFRQQLCSASTDSNQQAADMLDGTIEAFLAAEDGRLEDESYDGLVCDSSQRWLGPDVSDRSRSYSYGLLIGEAALRNGRRSTARMRQLGSTTQLAQGSFEESAPEAANEVGFGLTGFGGPAEQELAELRAENKLLRRQLENHPELFRLCSENRLLREHLATLVQHKASSHQDVDFYQERSKGRLAMDGTQDDLGEKDMSLARTTSRLLSSGEDGEAENARKGGEGQRLALKQFPGIEEVTHLSSDSGEDSDDSRRHESRDAGPRCSEHAAQGADVTSFIPAMSRQVQELFRVKNSMEDTLRRHFRTGLQSKAKSFQGHSRFVQVDEMGSPDTEVEVDPHDLEEALQGTTEALQHAEAMLAKGGCGELFVGSEEVGLGDGLRRRHNGMDERDVFLSLMRSLPGESQASGRQPFGTARAQSGQTHACGPGLAGSRLQRMKSTMQLHRIVEAPDSQEPELSPRSQGSDKMVPNPASPSDKLQLAIQQVHNLSKQLESVGEIYKDLKSQLEPMQQEYQRRFDECRFLESQCRRLDVHCRLLEDRVSAAEASGTIPRSQPLSSASIRQTDSPKAAPVQISPARAALHGTGRFIPVVQGCSQAPAVQMTHTHGTLQAARGPAVPQQYVSLLVVPAPSAAMGSMSASAGHLGQEATQVMPGIACPRTSVAMRRVYSAPQLLGLRSFSAAPAQF